jgi:hypothetical protein
MRGFVSYLLTGIVAVLVTDFVVLPLGFGLSVRARAVAEPPATTQFVDRTHKGDRLGLPVSGGAQQAPAMTIIGCDPPFSSLLSAARANAPGRCVAETASPLIG